MSIVAPLLQELEMESVATRRVLERLPADKLDWRPHPTSMSLGQLGLHVAGTPGGVAMLSSLDDPPAPEFGNNPQPASKDEILAALDESLAQAKSIVGGFSDEKAMENWSLEVDGNVALEMPRVALLRAIMLNHLYHHRGQLTVYLRMLEVPVPAVYGASLDENPFLA